MPLHSRWNAGFDDVSVQHAEGVKKVAPYDWITPIHSCRMVFYPVRRAEMGVLIFLLRVPSLMYYFLCVSSKSPIFPSGIIANMAGETPVKVFDEDIHEDAVLEKLGYQQELKRSFGLLGMIGFSFSIVTSWTALGGVLIVGVESGGPPVMIYSWIGISIVTLAVAYSMAEMCSAYPVAGGQYSWVAVLAPPQISRGMSYVTGWFMITGS